MKEFAYVRALSADHALATMREAANAKFLAGGTNLVDLMREGIERPDLVIDVKDIDLGVIEATEDGGLHIGATATNTAVAAHALVRERYPLLAQAIVFGASGQIRNMASVAGNLMQRTRCPYFYDQYSRCNKRTPGAGCDALEGFNRNHVILGGSQQCIATHPSDMCVALAALDAAVVVRGLDGERRVPVVDFHTLPGDTPEIETVLAPGELIMGIELPPPPSGRSLYRKVRDRSSYAFALVSVAAVVAIDEGKIAKAWIALGGVAPKPWRARACEQALVGNQATAESFAAAASAELAQAAGLAHNAFKIELCKRTIVEVLEQLAGRAEDATCP